jgi:DNA-binding NtrC family response regulator
MCTLRAEIWAASFGRSLWHALVLERVMRDDDVLILGETGTGKELVAAALQEATPGNEKGDAAPRGAINAAALPETLIESELFGYVKGAFTGANENRTGRIRSAHTGCFFLDEVGDLPLATQVKLLRVLESDEITPLGSDQNHIVDVRFVAATHKDLRAMVEEGRFRRDFYQRLAGLVIEIPALQDRSEDISSIGAAYVRQYVGDAEELAEETERVARWLRSPAARHYAWPGNVRELQNVIRTVLVGLTPDVGAADVDTRAVGGEAMPAFLAAGSASLREVGDWYIRRVVAHCEHNLAQASRVLGVDRSTIRRRLRQSD